MNANDPAGRTCFSRRGARVKNVLVVEDHAQLAAMLSVELAPIAQVSIAATLAQARQHLASRQFDAVVLDIMLADSQSRPTLDAVQAMTAAPIIIYSAGSPEFYSGWPVYSVISKSKPPSDVRTQVQCALERTPGLPVLPRPNPSGVHVPVTGDETLLLALRDLSEKVDILSRWVNGKKAEEHAARIAAEAEARVLAAQAAEAAEVEAERKQDEQKAVAELRRNFLKALIGLVTAATAALGGYWGFSDGSGSKAKAVKSERGAAPRIPAPHAPHNPGR